ncbi:hypothetical protein K458DRAFT_289569, partial [Lentithecium fluviatile CBS 122367]
YIGCASWNWSNRHSESHFIQHVPPRVDIQYFQHLFTHGLPSPETAGRSCNVVEPRNARSQPCPVVWDILFPEDIQRVPYFLLIATGTHSHIPPPPFIAGEAQLQAIKNILHPMLTPALTRSQFLNSPQLAAYLTSRGLSSIEDLSLAFANKDRISRIIKQEKLVRFPYGSGIEAVLFDWKTHDQNPETAYIRRIISSVSGNIIVCFYKQAAKILLEQVTFQMDMSYKRLQRPWSEILVVIFHSQENKLLTLGRIITDTETRDMYQIAMTAFFDECSKQVQKPVQWSHIHHTGITVDMDWKQAAGFCRYLTSVDPSRRDWTWHFQCTIRFCQVHFMRGVTKAAAGEERTPDTVWGCMMDLLNAKTRAEYWELLSLLETEEKPSVRAWAKDKKSPITASGLVQCFSNLSKQDWNTLESHSNAAEQAGQKGYRSGQRLSLHAAVSASRKMDLQDIKEYDAFDKYGIRHAHRAASTISERYFQNRARDARTYISGYNKVCTETCLERKRKQFQDSIIISDDEDESLLPSSSSGYTKLSHRGRKGSLRPRDPSRSRSRSTVRSGGISPSPVDRYVAKPVGSVF